MKHTTKQQTGYIQLNKYRIYNERFMHYNAKFIGGGPI
jgi:hypothetical protein